MSSWSTLVAMEQLKTRSKYTCLTQTNHLKQCSSLNLSCAIWFMTHLWLQGSLVCLTVAELILPICQPCVEEEPVQERNSNRREKRPCADISISKHAGQEESLTQMAVLLNAFMTTALKWPRGHKRARWSSQLIGFVSNGPQVKSATVEETITWCRSPLSESCKDDRQTCSSAHSIKQQENLWRYNIR